MARVRLLCTKASGSSRRPMLGTLLLPSQGPGLVSAVLVVAEARTWGRPVSREGLVGPRDALMLTWDLQIPQEMKVVDRPPKELHFPQQMKIVAGPPKELHFPQEMKIVSVSPRELHFPQESKIVGVSPRELHFPQEVKIVAGPPWELHFPQEMKVVAVSPRELHFPREMKIWGALPLCEWLLWELDALVGVSAGGGSGIGGQDSVKLARAP